MKLSVSLPEEDVEFLDAYARERGIETRSAALHQAVRALRVSQLGPAYDAAFTDPAADEWDETSSDGLDGR